MPVVYPSKEWMDELLKTVNSDEKYKQVAARWEGDFLCIVEVDEEALKDFSKPKVMAGLLSMLDTIPKEKRLKFRGTLIGDFIEKKLGVPVDADISSLNPEELAKKVSEVKPEEVKGATLNIWMDFWHGELRKIEVVVPGEHEDARFKLIGPYSVYKEMVRGKTDAISLVMRGKLKLEGDLSYMMRNMAAIRRFAELMGSIPIEEV